MPRAFLGVSIGGPSREGFYFSPAGRFGDVLGEGLAGDSSPRIFPDGSPHRWSLSYDPPSGAAAARMTVTLDDRSVAIPIPLSAQAEEAVFDRFGFVTTWVDGNAQEVYFDDLTYTVSQDE
jgi:hypothetical protein